MLLIVPWGVDRSALHVGRREGDAVWYRRSDRRIPPRESVVKLSQSRTCGAGQRAATPTALAATQVRRVSKLSVVVQRDAVELCCTSRKASIEPLSEST